MRECFEKLLFYKASKGKAYKRQSDYLAILRWVVEAVKDDRARRRKRGDLA